ncbi:hypothetical protein EVAR_77542_1 [Eumeta japonica]|uniref:Uncharacterized protein n=1 Tax=Eumeta variegata TaxID=151549 RepID=A0A4C1T7F1_EUMVA|nr:hypothetical protein EVAR_77542_1 [Eumeta japonica]
MVKRRATNKRKKRHVGRGDRAKGGHHRTGVGAGAAHRPRGAGEGPGRRRGPGATTAGLAGARPAPVVHPGEESIRCGHELSFLW